MCLLWPHIHAICCVVFMMSRNELKFIKRHHDMRVTVIRLASYLHIYMPVVKLELLFRHDSKVCYVLQYDILLIYIFY